MNKAQAEAEAAAVNKWAKKAAREKPPCSWCEGRRRQYAPLYSDPNLGYADNGRCPYCKGTGKAKQ